MMTNSGGTIISENLRIIGESIIDNRLEILKTSMEMRMEEEPELAKKIMSQEITLMTQEEAQEFTATFITYLGEALSGDEGDACRVDTNSRIARN
ncbi:hypothetical protein ACJROX_09795 [Pseudalkalibacillus sp. A8]|uniref:hypothetical protein n=1 Tax=Pseudalkalibacillus sp. A8 TaxID=3382641 RepID=UPI0038B54B83